MAVLDDKESKVFLFSYENLFGTIAKSKTDLENEQQNKDSAISRTRRLFYVVCSRAQKSLAVVAYTSDPYTLKSNALGTWFKEDEVIVL
jgi:DNA helicase-2/ATP-dependent DNA helicase PcrA